MFFKISEGLKLKDAEFKAKMNKIEKNYERVIDSVSKDPESIAPEDIPEHFAEKEPEVVEVSRSMNVGPLGRFPVGLMRSSKS